MKRSRGFTLTEMMFVIAAIAILAGIGVPVGMSLSARAKEAACLQNLGAIGGGLENYMRDNGGRLPELQAGRKSRKTDAPVMDTVLLEYVGNERIFCCPAGVKEFRKTGSSYFWNSSLNGMPVAEVSFFGIRNSPELIPLASDKEAWHPHATNFLYADGSASDKVRFSTDQTNKEKK